MKSKRYLWHKHWSWNASGQAQHDSGLSFVYDCVDDEWEVDISSIGSFAAHEIARGVPEWQHSERIARLSKEVHRWLVMCVIKQRVQKRVHRESP